jgi:NADH-quinone oxidoreductase subunit F
VERVLTRDFQEDGAVLDRVGYERAGGYEGMRAALAMTPAEVTARVKDSGLRGRGGAGFPTGLKWSFVPPSEDVPAPRYFIANCDEMEPGTFKDRHLMERAPHQLLEGTIIAAYAVQASVAVIFVRREYALAIERVRRAIAEATEAGYVGPAVLGTGWGLEIRVHVSAGRYMCGEETGLLNALEGRRAIPRSKPPFPQTSGVWGKPSVVNNCETVCNLPHILAKGGAWFKALSAHPAEAGTKLFGASGSVRNPGLWELPMGTPLREIVLERAGGVKEGARLRGVLPGGASTAFVTEEHLDVPLGFSTMDETGSRLGTGTVVALDDRRCPVGMVLSLIRFFARESCGWCTPCREGLRWVEQTLEALESGDGLPGDIEVLEKHVRLFGPMGRTFCALAPGAMAPLESALTYFREDFERHVSERRCPWR